MAARSSCYSTWQRRFLSAMFDGTALALSRPTKASRISRPSELGAGITSSYSSLPNALVQNETRILVGAHVALDRRGDERIDVSPLLGDLHVTASLGHGDHFPSSFWRSVLKLRTRLGHPFGLPLWPGWNLESKLIKSTAQARRPSRQKPRSCAPTYHNAWRCAENP
jgi:hypothetical protein